VTEVGLTDAGCDHQTVVRESGSPPIRTDDGHRLFDEVDIGHVAELDLRVRKLSQHFSCRRRDRAGREDAGRDLVEQRLEQVVVRAVDECDLDRRVLEEFRGEQPPKPAPTITTRWFLSSMLVPADGRPYANVCLPPSKTACASCLVSSIAASAMIRLSSRAFA
jgi:hypothetical protein